MPSKRILLAAALAVFVVAIFAIVPTRRAAAQSAAAAQKSSPSNPGNITATIHDYDALGGLMLFRSDDYNGSGQATYTASSSRGSSLGSGFDGNGEWVLNLGNQSLRTVYVTPNFAIDNLQPPGPPAGYYFTLGRTGCFDQNGNIVPLANVLTASGNCKLGINFSSAGIDYKLLMSPFPLSGAGDPPPTCPAGGCPATGVVKVTCNAVISGKCVNWTIEPNASASHANVANLYRYSSAKKSTTWVFIGQYFNSFRIGLTNP